jgi:hypothetical protein
VRLDGGVWAPADGPFAVSFEGTHIAEVIAWDRAGNEATASVSFEVGAGGGGGEDPPAGDFAIDGGRLWTNKYEAPATCDIAGAAEMRMRVAGGEWGAFGPYSAEATVTLPLDEGPCTVEAEFRNGTGAVTARADEIGIDRTPGSTSSNIDRQTYRSPEPFYFVGDDARSGPGDKFYRVDDGPVVADDECLVSEPGSHTVEYWSADLAGNESEHVVASYRLTYPTQIDVTVTPDAVGSGETVTVTGTVTDGRGGALSGKDVIAHYSYNGTDWFDVPGTFAADQGDGTYTISHAPAQDALYRLTFYEDEWCNFAQSGAAAVEVRAPEPTTLALSTSATLVNYGGSVSAYGVLKDSQGAPVPGSSRVALWRKPYGGSWAKVTNATWDAANARYKASTTLTIGSYLQLRYEGDPGFATSSSSAPFVKARAKVGTPSCSSTMSRSSYYTVYGYLWPRHSSGSSAVTLKCYRYESGSYRYKKSVSAKVANYSSY